LRLKHLRLGAAIAILSFLLVLFVPIVYDARLFACQFPQAACLTNPSGLNSLGNWLFHWGATFSLETGWPGPTFGYSAPAVGSLTSFGVLLFFALPLVAASIGLLAPEVIRESRARRVGLTVFGAFVFVFSVFLLVSTIPAIASLGPAIGLSCLILIWEGGAMAFYGIRPRKPQT